MNQVLKSTTINSTWKKVPSFPDHASISLCQTVYCLLIRLLDNQLAREWNSTYHVAWFMEISKLIAKYDKMDKLN